MRQINLVKLGAIFLIVTSAIVYAKDEAGAATTNESGNAAMANQTAPAKVSQINPIQSCRTSQTIYALIVQQQRNSCPRICLQIFPLIVQ